MNIRHLVLSSGSLNGINMVGILYEALSKNVLKYENIKTIHGCSAGSIVLALWLTKIKREDLYNFIINRPWDKTFNPSHNIINGLIMDKGILDIEHFNKILTPVFKAQEIDPAITLMEFYKYTNIEFHIYSTDINTFNSVDFSYKTHPDLKLFNAIYMSSSIPFIFKPIYYNGTYYIDGGISNKYPIQSCLDNGGEEDNILGLKITRHGYNNLKEDCSIMTYGLHIVNMAVRKIMNFNFVDTKHQIDIQTVPIISIIDEILSSSDKRKELLIDGENSFNEFLKSSV